MFRIMLFALAAISGFATVTLAPKPAHAIVQYTCYSDEDCANCRDAHGDVCAMAARVSPKGATFQKLKEAPRNSSSGSALPGAREATPKR